MFKNFMDIRKRDVPSFGHVLEKTTIKIEPKLEEEGDYKGRAAWHKPVQTAINLEKAFKCDDTKLVGKSKESQVMLVISAEDTLAPLENPLCLKLWVLWTDLGIAFAADDNTIYGYVECACNIIFLTITAKLDLLAHYRATCARRDVFDA